MFLEAGTSSRPHSLKTAIGRAMDRRKCPRVTRQAGQLRVSVSKGRRYTGVTTNPRRVCCSYFCALDAADPIAVACRLRSRPVSERGVDCAHEVIWVDGLGEMPMKAAGQCPPAVLASRVRCKRYAADWLRLCVRSRSRRRIMKSYPSTPGIPISVSTTSKGSPSSTRKASRAESTAKIRAPADSSTAVTTSRASSLSSTNSTRKPFNSGSPSACSACPVTGAAPSRARSATGR